MKNLKMYEPGDKMITLIKDNYSVLAVVNFTINGYGAFEDDEKVTLYDIYNNEEWLHQHAEVEVQIFTPAIKRLERMTKQDDVSKNISSMVFKGGQDNGEVLSDRERDVIICVVQGLQNKEIANKLYISVNTVITHRRNIALKLQIHSPAGLTIYAIVNGLVDISSVKL